MSSIHILSLITFYLRYFQTFILVMFVLNTRLDDLAGDQFQTGYSNREFVCNLSKCCNVSTLMVNEKTVMMPQCAIVCHICRTVWLQKAIFSFIKQDRENWFSYNVSSNILLPWTKLVLWSLLFYCYRNQDFIIFQFVMI